MNWIKKNATSLSIILVSSLLSLVLAEVGLRLFNDACLLLKHLRQFILRGFRSAHLLSFQYNRQSSRNLK